MDLSLQLFWADIRCGVRQLRGNPGFTAVAIITLALGIGANTAIFSVVDAVLLRPFPYPHAGRMVVIHESLPRKGLILNDSWPDFEDWRAQTRVFERIAALQRAAARLSGIGQTRMIPGLRVSESFFSLFGARPILGRTFSQDEAKPGAAPVAVVSYSFWRDILEGDKHAIGRTITVNNQSVTVIGVLPPNFELPFSTKFDIYFPIRAESDSPRMRNRADHPGIWVVAKLRHGISLRRARVEMDTIMDRLSREYPGSNRNEIALVIPLVQELVGKADRMLFVLLGATGFVLLLACANVAHMALARSATRQREFAVRASLGASRWRLISQLLVEHLPLAVLGGALGLVLAAFSLKPLVRMYPGYLFRLGSVHLDGSVLFFAFAACLVAWLLFGLAPAIEVRRSNLYASLKKGGYGGTGPKGRRLRSALFAAEIAIALVVVVGMGLLARSLIAALDVNPGFRPDHLLAVRVLRWERSRKPQQDLTFLSEALSRISHLPGVESASAAMSSPLGGTPWISPYVPKGRPPRPNTQEPWTAINLITPGYFRTLGAQLIAGRRFTDADDASSNPVAIVNETMARSISPLRNLIGKRIYVSYYPHPVLQVVGVVHDVKQYGLDRSDMPEVYVPFAQFPLGAMTIMVRTFVNPDILAHAVVQTVHNLDTNQPLPQAATMNSVIASELGARKFAVFLMSLFTALALTLAAVGVSGVVAYTVAERNHEIGIRMALGAQRSEVLWLIVRQATWPALWGIGIGFAAAWGLTRLLASMLFGVKSHDPLTFITAAVLLAAVSLAACYIPARRAMSVDPMVALRYE